MTALSFVWVYTYSQNSRCDTNIELINTSHNASQFKIWQNLNLSNPTVKKFNLHKLEGMKKYYIANVNSVLQEYIPDTVNGE